MPRKSGGRGPRCSRRCARSSPRLLRAGPRTWAFTVRSGTTLAFQFPEPVRLRHTRPSDQRDLVLHLPDRLYVLDRKRETATCFSYEFEVAGASTEGIPRGVDQPVAYEMGEGRPVTGTEPPSDPRPGSFARVVEQARGSSPGVTCSRWSPATSSTGPAARPRPSTSGCGSVARRRTGSSSAWGRASTWSARRRRCTCGWTGDRVETCPDLRRRSPAAAAEHDRRREHPRPAHLGPARSS